MAEIPFHLSKPHPVQGIQLSLFNGADIKVEVAIFYAAMDTLIDQDDKLCVHSELRVHYTDIHTAHIDSAWGYFIAV